ncbi:hypothetical protein SAMD00019534_083380 [Acytostelium subglobosum LB1]|uniref:hypothetical protein n=1 Tax=Acytostelium subglobosum LB1 TaxID=1410327 RepID=UPI000644A93F|nr:hypothetical protein SAMD00019534_083380 [Acytostelium subglobosum LB1]GAM25163.1 hypothetical protein SAMD00019534_083380 [Acytostelium subglobosum LB1]|eukprot:XP_012751683.1 hypothetical protein SAMD00019534_083380 [Acytostelium subglobosum LB1]
MKLDWVLPDRHVFPSIVATSAISMWTYQAFMVKRARDKANVKAPNVNGDEEFEKVLVSYQHTTEGLPSVLASSFLCSYFLCPKASLGLGLGWVLSRLVFSCNYCCNKEKDCSWMKCIHLALSHGCHIGLLLGSIFGIAVSLSNRHLLIKGA